MHHSRGAAGFLASLVIAAAGTALAHDEGHDHDGAHIRHVLLISVDGLHAVDLARCIASGTCPNLARLSHHGVTYTNASASEPSDSFPGLLAMLTGGTPRTTGVYYDDSYDRSLFAPGSNCTAPAGTEVALAENLDTDLSLLNGGVATSLAGNSANAIDSAQLPLALIDGRCTALWPHNFVRVNTLFGVLHHHGLRTAWSDKHPAYDLVNGPDGRQGPGRNVDDFFAPEINSAVSAENVALITSTPPAGLVNPNIDFTGSIQAVQFYDGIKVAATLNQIRGLDHTGKRPQSTPALFGMNFQAVSVGQKLPGNGYLDTRATPSAGLASSIAFVDRSIGSFVEALSARGLTDSTLIILSAKHGQSPIDPSRFTRIPDAATLTPALNAFANDDAFHIADDAVVLDPHRARPQSAGAGSGPAREHATTPRLRPLSNSSCRSGRSDVGSAGRCCLVGMLESGASELVANVVASTCLVITPRHRGAL